jgi:hypothetical protein
MNIKVTVIVHDEDEGTIHASALAKYIVGDLPVDEMVEQFAEEALEGIVAHAMAPDYHHLVPRFTTSDDDKAYNDAPKVIVSDEFDAFYGGEVVTPADAEAAADAALKRARESFENPKPWSQRGMKSSGGESPGFPPAPINKDYNDFVALAGGLRGKALTDLQAAGFMAGRYEDQASDLFVDASNFVGQNIEGETGTFDYDEVDPDHALQATFDAGFMAAVKWLRKD